MQDHATKLSPKQLRWKCESECFDFETTADLDPATEIIGQSAAKEALLFGIECLAPGQNIYVRGTRGTGRLTMVRRILGEMELETDAKKDRCYVHNFKRPDHPRLITLEAGQASDFKRQIGSLAEFVQSELFKALDAEPHRSKRAAIQHETQEEINTISRPLEDELADNAMGLVQMQQGPINQTVIFPLVEGKPMPPDQMRALVKQGQVEARDYQAFEENFPKFQKRLGEVRRDVSEVISKGRKQVEELNETIARMLLKEIADPIREAFPGQSVAKFIDELIDDAIEFRMESDEDDPDLKQLYGVNIVLENFDPKVRPVVEEVTPNLINLLGTVEPSFHPDQQQAISDYRGIRAGALLAADQGYLVLDAQDVLVEPGAWRSLMRTIRTGRLEIVPPEFGFMQPHIIVQPEPIEIQVRVILIGDVETYYKLDYFDSDFGELFKVLADFDNEMDRNESSVRQYASVVAGLCKQENLPHFQRNALGALVEHGSRIAGRANKITTRFGRIADIAREAAFLAKKEGIEFVSEENVKTAIRRTKKRASLPSKRFQEMIGNRTIMIETDGEAVGQINGLAVMKSGPLTYGFPARITSTIGPGRAGLINIEGRAKMSGAIHTKGFHILGGLLRSLLKLQHPMAVSASMAFEQSYGGIDGDSASGAEMICLLSALTGFPIKQSLAITGAIDQHGKIQAIGGVNEKIEGFYDACNHFSLTGNQGCLIPSANAAELMLRDDIVQACKDGKFHVYAVSTIHEAIEIMIGVPAGEYGDSGYPEGSVLYAAVEKAHEFWRRTLASPDQMTSVERAEEPDENV